MNVDVELLSKSDNPRLVMISMLNSTKLPGTLKVLGYAMLNTASEVEIIKLKTMFINTVHYIENKDTDGLKSYLISCGIDAEILQLLVHYASANTN